jgi:hypothetical protein
MSSLFDLTMVVFIFSPLVMTIALVTLIAWLKIRKLKLEDDGPERLLSTAIRFMPAERSEWGDAMMAELIATRGASFRWSFALGCARTVIFPPGTTSLPWQFFDTLRRLRSQCGILAVALPPLGLPLLWTCAVAADAFTDQDNFTFADGLIPGLVGSMIFVSLAFMLSGVPLGIAGLMRHEQVRWLSKLGPCLSVSIISYFVIVMNLANAGVKD